MENSKIGGTPVKTSVAGRYAQRGCCESIAAFAE